MLQRLTTVIFAGFVLAVLVTGTSAVEPLRQAHAHNDYRHTRPLLDALDHGFCSVEADIFLVDGQLLVGHDRWELKPERTLETLYLAPLAERVRANGGRVYKDGPTVTLLIDIKTNGEATWPVLNEALGRHPDVFSRVEQGRLTEGPVLAVVSGDRPVKQIEATSPRYAGIDGRLSDLDSDVPAHLLPLISDHWFRHFHWDGKGTMPQAERQKLTAIVAQVHDSGRRLRFWATPDVQPMWQTLEAANVDLINTDDLPGLSRFLRKSRSDAVSR